MCFSNKYFYNAIGSYFDKDALRPKGHYILFIIEFHIYDRRRSVVPTPSF